MKVIKCDRCAKIYDPIRNSNDICNQLSFGYELKKDGVNKHKSLYCLDLCPECADTEVQIMGRINIPDDHINQYIELFGYDPIKQIDILQEECAELIQALSKYKRIGYERFTTTVSIDNIVEELTHVVIFSEIVSRLLNIQQEDINNEINKKL